MRIGIYTRKDELRLPTIEWMRDNGFDSFKIFEDEINDEFGDISEREGLNELFFSAEASSLDAVYVADLKIISQVSIKILQVLILLQDLNLPLFHEQGSIQPSDRMIKIIHDEIIDEWMRIQKETKQIDFT
jgi:DNA invertase Pin-like site-specific DNA recombinase